VARMLWIFEGNWWMDGGVGRAV